MRRYIGPELLRFSGALGHTAIVTCMDGARERTYAETYPERAAATYRELGDKAGRIFYRVFRPRIVGWKEVPYRVAVLDEPL